MSGQASKNVDIPVTELIDQLFLHFLVGKHKIDKDINEKEYNDGLLESESSDKTHALPLADKNGRNQRILLDVEKQRVKREQAELRVKAKRNAVLTRYFQQLLLKVIHEKLQDNDNVINDQLQLRENALELLKKLLAGESRYSILASLLELNISTRNRLLFLVSSKSFMEALGRDARYVRDSTTAISLIGMDALRFLIPAILFKYSINTYSRHNNLFAKKLWRYEITVGQACNSLMLEANYSRPYEGMLLSAMLNFAYVASYQQYQTTFDELRMFCLQQARDKGEKAHHDFFFDIQTDSASLQALLVSQADLKLTLLLSEKLFQQTFPHLVAALKEEVEGIVFEKRSLLGQILFKAIRFAKYDQLRASRLFKGEWLDDYLHDSHLDLCTYNKLLSQELFRFKPLWWG